MLRIDNLEIIYKDDLLLSADYFNLNSGEKAVILGNNDSGKSLLLRAIHGTFADFKGSIFIKERSSVFYKKRKQTIYIDSTNRILENETLWKNLILPFPSLTARTKLKLTQFCEKAGIDKMLVHKAKHVSSSTLKLIEIIRAVIQLPYIIIIDDVDVFFDNNKFVKALEILDHASDNGSCVMASARDRIEGFDFYYRIQNGKLVKL